MITVKMGGNDNEAGSHRACQQALGVHANVVVKTKACLEMDPLLVTSPTWADPSAAGDYGERLATTMLKRATV